MQASSKRSSTENGPARVDHVDVLAGGMIHPDELERMRALLRGDNALDVIVLDSGVLGALLNHVDVLEERLGNVGGVFCASCGCTQEDACEPGCSWVADGLCSACRYCVRGCDDGMEGHVVHDLVEGRDVCGELGDLDDEMVAIVYMHRADAEARCAELNGRDADDAAGEERHRALCTGCGDPATTTDSMDVPLCAACFDALDPVSEEDCEHE